MAPIDRILQKGHSSNQKYHLTKIAANINDTSQKWHLPKTTTAHKNGISKLTLLVFWSTTNTLPIETTPTTIRHKLEKLDFKIPRSWVWIIQI